LEPLPVVAGLPGTDRASTEQVSGHDTIVIGASAGGLRALQGLVACLPRELPAACFAVLHMQRSHDSQLAAILNAHGTLTAKFAEDGELPRRGMLFLAPPGRHLVLQQDRIRLSDGPREHYWRPSVDVLFRTAAVAFGSRVVGVVLSGSMDDGVAGLSAVRACGGEALVQHPEEAEYAEMPHAALQRVEGARGLPIAELCDEIVRLARAEARESPSIPPELELEARIATDPSNLASALAMPNELSLYNCPECGGPLAAEHDRPLRFRCTVGHGFTAASLQDGIRSQIEASLWVAIRLLQQRSNLRRQRAETERQKGRMHGADNYFARADEDWAHADVLRGRLLQLNAGEAARRPTAEAEELS
jgi:two-component system, chemotaxis family, protein-glutamate methylesterase/glutaminase